jgi:TP901 family phage tail tape measure protein
MGLAVVGIKVQVDGIATANLQFRALQASIDQTVAAAAKLKGMKVPSTVNIANAFGANSFAVGAIDNSVRSYENLGKTATATATRMLAVKTAANAVGAGLSKITGTVLSFGKAIKSAGDGMQVAGRRIQSFGSSVTMLGSRMTTFISLPIVAGLGKSVQAAAKFEEQMVNLRTQVDLSAEEVGYFQAGLLNMVPALGKTATELGAAGYAILSRDLRDVDLALKVLEGSAKASAIGLGETEDIAKIITAVMVSYGATNLDAADANIFLTDTLDQLMAAIQRGSLEADDMVGPMGKLLGTASELNVGFAELTAAMGTYGATGQSGSEVVTSINRILASFVKPTKSSLDALDAIGSSWDEIRAKISDDGEGLADTLFYLKDSFDDAGISITEFFGRLPAINAFYVLTGGAAELYLESLDEILDSAGSLEEAFDITKTKTTFMWDQMKASAEAFAIVLGTHLLPEVQKILAALQPLIEKAINFVNLNPELVKMAVVFGLVVAAIGPVLILFGIFIASVGAVITAIGTIVSAIGFLLSPIGLVIGLITAAAAALAGVWLISIKDTARKSSQEFNSMADAAWYWGHNIVMTLAQGMADAIIAVVNVLIEIGNTINYWLQGHSPPKLLPDLEKWGTNVMDVFLGGMTMADFSIFDSVAGILERQMRAMAPTDDTSLVPEILNMREVVAQALSSGSGFTQEVLDEITYTYGALSENTRTYIAALVDLAVAQGDVAAAQEEVNAANKTYEDAMKPLNKELESFKRFGEDLNDADRKRVLERRLKDPRTGELEKQLILMDLRGLEIKKTQRQLGDERDLALEAANAKLDAATAEVERLTNQSELSKKIIEEQITQRDLWQEQIDLIERLEEAANRAGSAISNALGGGGGGIGGDTEDTDSEGGAVPGLPPAVSSILSNLTDAFGEDGLVGKIRGAIDEIKLMFEPLIGVNGEGGLLATLADVWSDIFTNPEALTRAADLAELAVQLGVAYGAFVLIKGVLGGVKLAWEGMAVALGIWKTAKGTDTLINIAGAIKNLVSVPFLISAGPWILAIAGAILLMTAAIEDSGGWPGFVERWSGLFDQIKTIKDLIFGVEDEVANDLATASLTPNADLVQSFLDTERSTGNFVTTIQSHAMDASNAVAGIPGTFGTALDESSGYMDDWSYATLVRFPDTLVDVDTAIADANFPITFREQLLLMERDQVQKGVDIEGRITDHLNNVNTLHTAPDFVGAHSANMAALVEDVDNYVVTSDTMMAGGLTAMEQGMLEAGLSMPVTWSSSLTSVTNEFAPWQEDMKAGGYQGGFDFGAGLESGVTAKLPALEAAIRGAATVSRKTWNDYWQVMSPSKAAAEDAGYIMEGYAKGLEGTSYKLSDAMKNVASDMRVSGLNVDANRQYSQQVALSRSAAESVSTNTITIGPNNITNGMDYAVFEAMVQRSVMKMMK